jgi:hypothetical protein
MQCSRFRKIQSVALDKRLCNTTANLQQWLAKIDDQKKVSESLFSHNFATQLTLHQVWTSLPSPTVDSDKFPP